MIDIDRDRWQRLRPLLDRVIDLDVEERNDFLRTLRGEDKALGDDLERLLAEYERLRSRTLPNALKLVASAIACKSADGKIRHDIATSEPTDTIP